MAGSAGKGRPKGARNRRTLEAHALIGEGETPVEFGLRLMRDESISPDLRIHAARIAAPFIHPKPLPLAERVSMDLPEIDTPEGVTKASAAILKAVASGALSVNVGRDLVAIVDSHRRSIELSDIETRLKALEARQGRIA